jgi:hypothetical protein
MQRMSLRRHEHQHQQWLQQKQLFEQRQQEQLRQQQSTLALPAPLSPSLPGESVPSRLGQVAPKDSNTQKRLDGGPSKSGTLPSATSAGTSSSLGAAPPAGEAGAVVPAPPPRAVRLRSPPLPSIPVSQLLLPYAVFVPGAGALFAAAQYVPYIADHLCLFMLETSILITSPQLLFRESPSRKPYGRTLATAA